MTLSHWISLALLLAGCDGKDTPSGDDGGGDSGPTAGVELPALSGVAGSEGAVLWVDEAVSAGITLERDAGDGWQAVDAAMQLDDSTWVDEGAPAGSAYRLHHADTDAATDAVTPSAMALSIGLDAPAGIYADEAVAVEVEAGAIDGEAPPVSGAAVLSWETPSAVWFLDGDCVADGGDVVDIGGDCWTDVATVASVMSLEDGGFVALGGLVLPDGPSAEGALVAALAVDVGDGALHILDRDEAALVRLDRSLAWGDLHAHSNLSHDGCEEPDDNCNDTVPGEPGIDFFSVAIDRELDFVALTDHAEWLLYYPSGRTTGESFPVWEEQVARVQDAEAEGLILPLLGYEWTYFGQQEPNKEGHFLGGHKTVLLSETDVCENWRIGAREDLPYQKGVGGTLFVDGNPYLATSPVALYAAFDQTSGDCGDDVKVMSFMHHTASQWPQPVDFTLASNFPDPDYEVLIELYSEHGSSECYDLEAERCDWHIKSNSLYWPQGSVQAALTTGYQLGFTAGTDSHDSRPGPEDGPSCTANFTDTDGDGDLDSAQCHDWNGGVTGVMVEGALDRVSLWQGLRTRGTLATSGPRYPVRVFAVGQSGDVLPAGAMVPASEMPARLVASIEGIGEAAEAEILAIELIAADGSQLLFEDGELLDDELDLAEGEAAYIRIALTIEGEEHRVWASPFFGGG